MPATATIVEVGPRDGFQPIGPFIPTATKIDLVRKLHSAGLRRIEATAFVSDRAIPQLADAVEVLAAARALPGLDVQVLVPNQRYCDKALAAGADHIAFVLSVSEKHNMNNVRLTPAESIEEYRRLSAALPTGVRVRLNIATAFDCPFIGAVDAAATLAILDELVPIRPNVEIALCDTTGRVTPDRVGALFTMAMARHGEPRWAYHGHDTYGLGVANTLAAFQTGVAVLDAAFGGLGGCPFAPGATGNVATEDVVWAFNEMGIATGIDLAALIAVARDAAALPGAPVGGRVRTALAGAGCIGLDRAA
ncbi:hydroxymethylglutaryl-CoA lyase [Sphingomonas bacterium]|uniref:hydroxymethylglutaryl-CoA lyase n=1 Tax=Sphingomonas bacterium TaxID=1895847 RepID=UPI0015753B2A|nr:hydroxymethylglutaryl-CoA lyase [Sphingomonas bacterium]